MENSSSSTPRKGASHFPARAGRFRPWLALPILAVAGGFGFWIIQSGPDLLERGRVASEAPPIIAEPRIVTIGYGNVANLVSAAGALEPGTIVPVPVRSSGELVDILVEVGDRVEQGQVLALMDPTELQLQAELGRLGLERLKIQVPQRHMELETAQRAARRVEEAMATASDAASAEAEVERARNAMLTAQTTLENLLLEIQEAEKLLEQAERELASAAIEAPIDATVLEVLQRKGAILFAGTSAPVVAQLADLTKLSAAVEVSQVDVMKVDAESEAYLSTLVSADRVWPARVRQIEPRPTRRGDDLYFTVHMDVDNADSSLYPGMNVQVFFVTSSVENVLIVPVAALRYANDNDARNATVERVLPDGTIEPRDVVVGLADRINAEVVAGLEEGDRVVAGLIQT